MEIAEGRADDESSPTTLHLAGPPEFTAERALPALAELAGEGRRGFALRASFGTPEEVLEGLAAGHHDLAISTARPRGALFTATALCDEEHVLVAAPCWAGRLDPDALRLKGASALQDLPVVDVHESLPFVSRYWASVFDARPTAPGTVVAPDLRAVLACASAGAGLAVLPGYLCAPALGRGTVVALHEPVVPPLRTYFLVVRTGTLALPTVARAHEGLLRAAASWG